jgi:hypothetical protein
VKRGTVLIAEDTELRDDLVDRIRARDGDDSWVTSSDISRFTGRFSAHWQCEGGKDHRRGPQSVSAEEALAWGREQADRVLIRVGNGDMGGADHGYFSAGMIRDEDLPVWPASGLEVQPRPYPRLATGIALDEADARAALSQVVQRFRRLSYARLQKLLMREYPWIMRPGILRAVLRSIWALFDRDRLAIVPGSRRMELDALGPSGTTYLARVQLGWNGMPSTKDIRVTVWIDDEDYDPPERRVQESFVKPLLS